MKKIILLLAIVSIFTGCERDEDYNAVVTPIAQTTPPVNITATTAILTGKQLDGGGKVTARGFYYLLNSNNQLTEDTSIPDVNATFKEKGTKVDISVEGDFEVQIAQLQREADYCTQSYVETSKGISYGNIVFFKTSKNVVPTPGISKEYKKEEGTTNIVVSCQINAVGGSEVTERGIVWSNSPNPTVETGHKITAPSAGYKAFDIQIKDLEILRKYYIRTYATNQFGTGYSESLMAIFLEDTFVDKRDNESYKVKQYGNSIWMTQNFRHIPADGLNKEIWVQGYSGSSIAEAKATDNYKIYGCLYSYDVAIRLAPVGWHLATDAEWKELEMVSGLSQEQADKEDDWRGDTNYKLKGDLWEGIGDHDNSMQFNLLPGGKQWCGGAFQDLGTLGYCWTSTINEHRKDGQLQPFYRFFTGGNATGRFSDWPACVGLSIRYVMD